MITKSNLENMLKSAGFSNTSKDKYEKNYPLSDCSIIVDFRNEKIIYPEDKGFNMYFLLNKKNYFITHWFITKIH